MSQTLLQAGLVVTAVLSGLVFGYGGWRDWQDGLRANGVQAWGMALLFVALVGLFLGALRASELLIGLGGVLVVVADGMMWFGKWWEQRRGE